MIKEMIDKLIKKQELDKNEVKYICSQIENNEFDEIQLSSLLVALQSKGVSSDELTYFVDEMMSKAVLIEKNASEEYKDCIDLCGTGGDKTSSISTFNISTATVFVVAACDVKIAKHGNRSVSSKSGSVDVLEALGINISLDEEKAEICFNKTGIRFLYACKHHPVMKNISTVRKRLGIKTIFNMIGPLLNPANVEKQLLGVFDPKLTELFAMVLKRKDVKRAMVVHGNSLDELTITGKTKITELNNGKIDTYEFDPFDNSIGICNSTNKSTENDFKYGTLEELRADTKEDSAQIIKDIFSGKKTDRKDISRRNIVVLNSAAALIIAGKVSNFKEGIEMAKQVIDSGKVLDKLNQVIEITSSNSYQVISKVKQDKEMVSYG